MSKRVVLHQNGGSCWEVGEGLVHSLDDMLNAVMMSLWPSELELHGVEVRISRFRLEREAADPS